MVELSQNCDMDLAVAWLSHSRTFRFRSLDLLRQRNKKRMELLLLDSMQSGAASLRWRRVCRPRNTPLHSVTQTFVGGSAMRIVSRINPLTDQRWSTFSAAPTRRVLYFTLPSRWAPCIPVTATPIPEETHGSK